MGQKLEPSKKRQRLASMLLTLETNPPHPKKWPTFALSKMVQACEKSGYSSIIKLIPDTSEVKIRVRDSYTIQITPGQFSFH